MQNQQLRALFEAIKITGYKLPPELLEHEADTEKIQNAALAMRNTSTDYAALARAWATAIIEDRDPITDPDILNAIVANVLNQGDLSTAATSVHEHALIEMIPDHLDGIMASLKATADQAGETLTQAHDIIGTAELGDLARIAGMGPAAVTARDDVIESNRVLRVIDRAWLAMQSMTRKLPDIQWRLRMADMDLATYEKTTHAKKATDLVVKGVTINLAADASTIRARLNRLDEERAARDGVQRDVDERARGKYSVVPRI
ncbi:hypothetical protein [Microbacterium sp. Leaf179]|uniref:hypothetical protein n=1 Tax=Microbacterium sp. Leaf179 TaxID=1736288 RepID=UPI0007000F7D|nr:hypothetical protein [Microbacterium sp. Leaf179]KQR85186.1 hypothetical protein ASF96_14715 [Microbacterium sp. Leaf179]